MAFQLDGRVYRAAVTERSEHCDGREAVHLLLWPALPDGRRRAWFWWDPAVFEVRASVTAVSPVEQQPLDGDAVRIRPGEVPPDQIPTYELRVRAAAPGARPGWRPMARRRGLAQDPVPGRAARGPGEGDVPGSRRLPRRVLAHLLVEPGRDPRRALITWKVARLRPRWRRAKPRLSFLPSLRRVSIPPAQRPAMTRAADLSLECLSRAAHSATSKGQRVSA